MRNTFLLTLETGWNRVAVLQKKVLLAWDGDRLTLKGAVSSPEQKTKKNV
jgi:hypothetical protein